MDLKTIVKNHLLLSMLLLFFNATAFCQQDSLIRVSAKQDKSLLVISIHNVSGALIVFNRCFDFQTEGALNKPDLSILIKEPNGGFFTPIASTYSKIDDSCYVELAKDSVFLYSILLKCHLRDDVFSSNVKAKIRIETILIYNQRLFPRFITESPLFDVIPF